MCALRCAIKLTRLIHFDNRKLKHVIVSKWLEVIDIRKETYKQIETFIPYAKLPYKNNLNISFFLHKKRTEKTSVLLNPLFKMYIS